MWLDPEGETRNNVVYVFFLRFNSIFSLFFQYQVDLTLAPYFIHLCGTHQAPQGALLCCNDCGSPRRVVHESQLTKTALVVVLSHVHIHSVLLHKNIVHAPGNDTTHRRREEIIPNLY